MVKITSNSEHEKAKEKARQEKLSKLEKIKGIAQEIFPDNLSINADYTCGEFLFINYTHDDMDMDNQIHVSMRVKQIDVPKKRFLKGSIKLAEAYEREGYGEMTVFKHYE